MIQLDNHTRFFGNYCSADYKLEEIEYFHSELELLIKQEKSKLPNEVNNIDPVLHDKKYHYEYTLEQNLRASVIISLITFLEVELQNYCSDLQIALGVQLKYSDFKGSIMEQFKTYVNKVAVLSIDFSSPIYQKVKHLVELRNCIVHYEGQIENWYGRKFNRAESIQMLAKQIPSISIKENDSISLQPEACKECILIIKDFIEIIYKSAFDKFPKK